MHNRQGTKSNLVQLGEQVKVPEGYVSNLGRYLETNTKRLFDMKSKDYHVFMQELMPFDFRELLPSNVLQSITDLSLLFKDLTSTTLLVDEMGNFVEVRTHVISWIL